MFLSPSGISQTTKVQKISCSGWRRASFGLFLSAAVVSVTPDASPLPLSETFDNLRPSSSPVNNPPHRIKPASLLHLVRRFLQWTCQVKVCPFFFLSLPHKIRVGRRKRVHTPIQAYGYPTSLGSACRLPSKRAIRLTYSNSHDIHIGYAMTGTALVVSDEGVCPRLITQLDPFEVVLNTHAVQRKLGCGQCGAQRHSNPCGGRYLFRGAVGTQRRRQLAFTSASHIPGPSHLQSSSLG